MVHLEVYDPAMCCDTGVCGSEVDPALVRFAGDLEWLKARGVAVRRYNLAQEPAAFAARDAVKRALTEAGVAALPMVLLDGSLLRQGGYPNRAELAAAAGLSADEPGPASPFAVIGGGCAPGSGCC